MRFILSYKDPRREAQSQTLSRHTRERDLYVRYLSECASNLLNNILSLP